MSKIEELIAEFCPNGVEFRKIKDTFKRLQGTPITAEKMKEIDNPEGDIRIFAGGKTVINSFEKDIPKANITRVPAVLVQSRGVIDAIYYEEPFTFKNEMWAYTTEDKTSVKYLYYVLKNNIQQFRDAASGMGSLPQISLKVTEDFKIPLPPLPVQQEIVRILDNFTELTTELTAELAAELAARKKQYEYYRNHLLTFSDDVPMLVLGDVAQYSKGRISAAELNEDTYVGVDNLLQDKRGKTKSNYVPESGMCTKYQEGDILIGNIRPYLKKIWRATNTGGTNGDVLVINITNRSIISEYLYQLLSSDTFFAYDMQHAKGAKMPRGSKDAVMQYKIPVPPLEEQERIVAILDRFDALCNDLTSGLPAEIEARRKQYEYYRDKLLTFKEASA